jgi:hypothetical protein
VARVDALRSARLRAVAPSWRVRVVAAFLAVVERFVAAVRPSVLRGLAAAVERFAALERFAAAVRPDAVRRLAAVVRGLALVVRGLALVVRGLARVVVRLVAVLSAMWILVPFLGASNDIRSNSRSIYPANTCL